MAPSEIKVFPVPHSATTMAVRACCQRSATPIMAMVCAGKGSVAALRSEVNCIVKLVERWILLQNAVSQERRVTSHVVVNCGQFRHGSPLVRGGICGRE